MPAPLIERDALIERILSSRARKLTWIQAPTGYGKSTLLDLVYNQANEVAIECRRMSAGFANADGDLTRNLGSLLDSGSGTAGPEGIVIIDDFKVTTGGRDAAAFRSLLDYSSANLRFVVATCEPCPFSLMRLEARNDVSRIGLHELRFDHEEVLQLAQAADFPEQSYAGLDQLEGWPILTRFILHRYQSREARNAALPEVRNEVCLFLENEILSSLCQPERDRLLDCAIFDRFTQDQVEAVGGRSQEVGSFARLCERGLVYQAQDGSRLYQVHPVIRRHCNHLLAVEDQDRFRLTHQRAVGAMLLQGDRAGAIRHATASGSVSFLRETYGHLNSAPASSARHHYTDPPTALRFEPTRGSRLDEMSKHPFWKTVLGLIESEKVGEAKALLHGDARQTSRRMAEPLTGADRVWEEILVDLILSAYEDRLPPLDILTDLRRRVMQMPDVPEIAPASISELIFLAEIKKNGAAAAALDGHTFWHTILATDQAKIYMLLEFGVALLDRGEIADARRYLTMAQEAARLAHGPHSLSAQSASVLLSELELEAGNFEAAAELLDETTVFECLDEVLPLVAAAALTVRASLQMAQGTDKSPNLSDEDLGGLKRLWRIRPMLVACRLRLHLLAGEAADAAQTSRMVLTKEPCLDFEKGEAAGLRSSAVAACILADIRYDLAIDDASTALDKAAALRPKLCELDNQRRLIELDLLCGRAWLALGDRLRALEAVRTALTVSARTGLERCIREECAFIEPILAEIASGLDEPLSDAEHKLLRSLQIRHLRYFRTSETIRLNGRSISLSAREFQILRGISVGKSFKQIAFDLGLSINTIKVHRTRLYRKIDCNSRARASELARLAIPRTDLPETMRTAAGPFADSQSRAGAGA